MIKCVTNDLDVKGRERSDRLTDNCEMRWKSISISYTNEDKPIQTNTDLTGISIYNVTYQMHIGSVCICVLYLCAVYAS